MRLHVRAVLAVGLIWTSAACDDPATTDTGRSSPAAPRSATGVVRLAPGSGAGSKGKSGVSLGDVITVRVVELCTRGGPVRISAVRTIRGSGLALVDWGTNLRRNGQLFSRGTARPTYSRAPFDRACADDAGQQLAVSLRLTSPVGATHGLRVVFGRAGASSLTIPVRLYLCHGRCPASLDTAPFP